MSCNESETISPKLEDGEIIDESNELIASESETEANDKLQSSPSLDKNTRNADEQKCNEKSAPPVIAKEPTNYPQATTSDSQRSFFEESYITDEDEMICVRGASPKPYVSDRFSFNTESPKNDIDNVSSDASPPKRRKTSLKRHRKKSTPKKVEKIRKSPSDKLSPKITEDTQPLQTLQVCKFYIQDCCAKHNNCEYMHSDFPCKYFYMGLSCEDELISGSCKLLHGGVLSPEMKVALIKHVHGAPDDVLGKSFVELRNRLSVNEVNQMIHNMQEKLCEESKEDTEELDEDYTSSLRQKLTYLTDEQISKLVKLRITKPDDLLNLTLAQLNTIGISVIQIQAIQMSLLGGEDTDMRSLLPIELVSKEQTLDASKNDLKDTEDTNVNWYEQEEQPLIIDESGGDDCQESDAEEEIDVVGVKLDPSTQLENKTEESVEENNLNETAALEDSNEVITLNNEKTLTTCTAESTNTFDGARNETIPSEEILEPLSPQVIEEMLEIVDQDENIKCFKLYRLPSKKNDSDQESLKANDISQMVEDIIDEEIEKKISQNVQENPKNTEIDEISTSPESPKTTQEEDPKDRPQFSPTECVDFSSPLTSPKEQVELEICTENDSPLLKMSNQEHSLNENSRSYTPPLTIECIKETKRTSTTLERESSKKMRKEKIPITFPSPEKKLPQNDFTRQTNFQRKKVFERKRKNIRKDNDIAQSKECSPKKSLKDSFSSRSSHKVIDSKMKNDSSSEDWDADEQMESPPKVKVTEIICIDSPDSSEEEKTSSTSNDFGSSFPLRSSSNLENYKPALELDGHLTYPEMEYKIYEIDLPKFDVNKPTHINKLLKSNSSDPRVKKFVEKGKNTPSQMDDNFIPPLMSQCDPRLRPGYGNVCPDQFYNASPVLYNYLQRSIWYQELKSNVKIQINHSVSDLVRALNFFHKDPTPTKIFDLFQIECAGVLLEVMKNVGIFIDPRGNIIEDINYNEMCIPPRMPQPFCGGPQPKPGLLGFAPPGVPCPHQNIPFSSDVSNFMRQAFGNNNNEMAPNINSFYVGPAHFCENQGPDFDRRRTTNRNFKRR